MFKQGATRIPINKVPAFARSMDVDPAELLRLWLVEYEPEMLATIEGSLGLLLTPDEREWIEGLRQRFPDGLPPWRLVQQQPASNV